MEQQLNLPLPMLPTMDGALKAIRLLAQRALAGELTSDEALILVDKISLAALEESQRTMALNRAGGV